MTKTSVAHFKLVTGVSKAAELAAARAAADAAKAPELARIEAARIEAQHKAKAKL